jgi:hypothetical protein
MALKIEDTYPGKSNAADANYPQGSARNITTPGDGQGTPLEQAWLNDLFGMQQALLAEAGLTPSGNADTAIASQYLAAIKDVSGSVSGYVFSTAATMVAAGNLKLGQEISVLGRLAVGDGGRAEFVVVSGPTPDGFGLIDLGGGLVAKVQDTKDTATPEQLGLVGVDVAVYELAKTSIEGGAFPLVTNSTEAVIFNMKNDAVLSGVLIDGQSSPNNRVEIGADGGDNVVLSRNIISDCPINSLRTTADCLGKVHIQGNYASNSKLFNTNDLFDGQRLVVESNIVTNIPSEGILIDQPGVTSTYTGAIVASNIIEMSASGSRGVGFARSVATVSNSNIYKGNTGVDDLLHLEDKAELHISSSEVFMGEGAGRCIDGSLGGDITYPQVDRQPKSILINGDLIRADGADAIWFQGSEPLEFANLTITNNHIEGCNIPVSLRAKEGLVSGNVIYDPALSIVSTKQSITVADSSDDAHNVLVTNNHYIRPQFIRGNVGMCFDPNNIVFKTSFADEGAALTIGGSAGDSVISYPVDADGVKYFRITGGAAATTRRIDLEWAVGDIDFQNLDAISIQLMTKSSVADIGKVQVIFPNAGVGLAEYRINDTDNANWKVRGATKQAIGTDFYAVSAGLVQIRIWLGDNLADGDTLDIAWIKVSAVSAY